MSDYELLKRRSLRAPFSLAALRLALESVCSCLKFSCTQLKLFLENRRVIQRLFRSLALGAAIASAAAYAQRPSLIPEPREFQNREDISLARGVSVAMAKKDDAGS